MKRYAVFVSFVSFILIGISTVLFLAGDWSGNKIVGTGMVLLPESGRSLGPADAPVTIEVFLDFTCTPCADKIRLAEQARKQYPEQVRLLYHPYPFSSVGLKIAIALEAASRQDKFWQYYTIILEQVPQTITDIEQTAEKAGLNMADFNAVFLDAGVTDKVQAEKEQAEAKGIHNVSFYINGLLYDETPPQLEDILALIREALTKTEERSQDG